MLPTLLLAITLLSPPVALETIQHEGRTSTGHEPWVAQWNPEEGVTLSYQHDTWSVPGVTPGTFSPAVCRRDKDTLQLLWSVSRQGQWYLLRAPLEPGASPTLHPLDAAPTSRPLTFDHAGERCHIAQLTASGHLHWLRPEGDPTQHALLPAPPDPAEHPRGFALSHHDGTLYVADHAATLHAWRLRDRSHTTVALGSDVVGDLVFQSSSPPRAWWMTRNGTLTSMDLETHQLQRHLRTRAPAGSGLVPWLGRRDRGLVWLDQRGSLHIWSPDRHDILEPMGRPIEMTPLIADPMGDADLDVLFATRRGELVHVRERGEEFVTQTHALGHVPQGHLTLSQPDINAPPRLLTRASRTTTHVHTFQKTPARHIHTADAYLGQGVFWEDGAQHAEMLWPPAPGFAAPSKTPMGADAIEDEEHVMVWTKEPTPSGAGCSSTSGAPPPWCALLGLLGCLLLRRRASRRAA